MIGKISFHWHGSPATAVMGDDLAWSTPDPFLSEFLNTSPRYNSEEISPADGQPGRRKVLAAAEWLKGEVEWGALPDEPPGRIY